MTNEATQKIHRPSIFRGKMDDACKIGSLPHGHGDI